MSDCISPAQHLQGVIPVKNPERVAELLDALKAECEFRFEFDAVAMVAKIVSELPRVTVIDDNHQEFFGVCYGKNHGGYYFHNNRRLHRAVWKAFFGDIPDGYEIHHCDGNKDNNNIENLQCLSKSEHASRHQQKNREQRTCPVCGQQFVVRKSSRKIYCSPQCSGKAHATKFERKCVICGKRFTTRPSEDCQTCSPECGFKLQSQTKIAKGVRLLRVCPICGKEFYTWPCKPHKTCSVECGYALRRQRRRETKS